MHNTVQRHATRPEEAFLLPCLAAKCRSGLDEGSRLSRHSQLPSARQSHHTSPTSVPEPRVAPVRSFGGRFDGSDHRPANCPRHHNPPSRRGGRVQTVHSREQTIVCSSRQDGDTSWRDSHLDRPASIVVAVDVGNGFSQGGWYLGKGEPLQYLSSMSVIVYQIRGSIISVLAYNNWFACEITFTFLSQGCSYVLEAPSAFVFLFVLITP